MISSTVSCADFRVPSSVMPGRSAGFWVEGGEPVASSPVTAIPLDADACVTAPAHGVVLRVTQRTGTSQVLLCRSDSSGWRLPFSRPEPGESPAAALARELPELTGQLVWVTPTPGPRSGRSYGCHLAARRPLRLPAEHGQLAWLPVDDLPDSVPDACRIAILDQIGAG